MNTVRFVCSLLALIIAAATAGAMVMAIIAAPTTCRPTPPKASFEQVPYVPHTRETDT